MTRWRSILRSGTAVPYAVAMLVAVLGCAATGAAPVGTTADAGPDPVPSASRAPTLRALLVAIDDYTASRLPSPPGAAGVPARRQWPDLAGAVNDASAFRDALLARYGFAPAEVRVLLDQEASRQAILEAIEEHLVLRAGPGDHLVFFYAGHGARVINSKNGEPDGRDESLVPADSRLGAPDVRDKELRRLFNRALDRGATLTVILDSCHSGSGVRGDLPVRSVEPDPRDVADGGDLGPALEARAAVVLAAAQDWQNAQETWDEEHGRYHGAFSLALLRAIRRSAPGESVEALFRRTRAWLQGPMGLYQEPVQAGSAHHLSRAFLGGGSGTPDARGWVAVEKIEPDGSGVLLQGGWIDGLAVGSELVSTASAEGAEPVRLRVTAVEGLTRSRAEVVGPAAPATRRPVAVGPGDLFTPAGWSVPPGPPLLVWIPTAGEAVSEWASAVAAAAAAAGIAVVGDPTVGEPATHVLHRRGGAWRLVGADGARDVDGSAPAAVIDALSSAGVERLLIEHPVPPALRAEVEAALAESRVEAIADAGRADYLLLTRGSGADGPQHAWVRPGATSGDVAVSPLPLRGRWHSGGDDGATAAGLAADAVGLARVRAWLRLAVESPPSVRFPYRLELRTAAGRTRTGRSVYGGEIFGLQLTAQGDVLRGPLDRRYVYVFVVDRAGRCTLLFPEADFGNVENRFPIEPLPPYPGTIPLGAEPSFRVSEPFGVDSYYLLTSREPLADPRVLECRGVGERNGPRSALEELLAMTGGTTRGVERVRGVPETWSLDRLVVRSRPAGEAAGSRRRRLLADAQLVERVVDGAEAGDPALDHQHPDDPGYPQPHRRHPVAEGHPGSDDQTDDTVVQPTLGVHRDPLPVIDGQLWVESTPGGGSVGSLLAHERS
jgi:hypothetical protein